MLWPPVARQDSLTRRMPKLSENWSERRRTWAPRIAAVLYGVIAIMMVDLAVSPDRLTYVDATNGVLLVGIAMTLTRLFVRIVTREAEIGTHLPMKEWGAATLDSVLVMLFPALAASVIACAALATTKWTMLLNVILYFGVVAIFIIGFMSSYILDRNIRLGLTRGAFWALLALALVAIRKSA